MGELGKTVSSNQPKPAEKPQKKLPENVEEPKQEQNKASDMDTKKEKTTQQGPLCSVMQKKKDKELGTTAVDRVDPDDESFRVASGRVRSELHAAVEETVKDKALATARKQLLDKVLACAVRMVNLHDESHILGNEIRDRNAVIADLDSKINWNQSRIDDESRQKFGNTKYRDELVEKLAQAEQLGKIKDKSISEVNSSLQIQNGKNSKLQNIVDTAERSNLKIRTTLEDCRDELTQALN